ncbi:hypothetical protein F2Q69_00009626 [Brassica cretica]|uniref:Uncharacterized protein n=1 Tax=Brassica cretica TaxID=69181 RepID=A0A8S9P9N5_BRACR|nr:hypothetical protein F2Q69_00009626 [Brassica cretica]
MFVGKLLGIYRGRASSGYFDGFSDGPILGSSDEMFFGIFIGRFRGKCPSENSEERCPSVYSDEHVPRFESSDTQPSCGRNSGSSLITIAQVNPVRELSPALLLAE